MHLEIPDWLARSFLGNSPTAWAAAVATALAAWLVFSVARRLVVRRLSRFAARTETHLDDFVVLLGRKTRLALWALVALYVGSLWLHLDPKLQSAAEAAAILALLLQAALWVSAAIDFWVARYRDRRLATDAASATTVVALRFLGKLTLYSTLLLLALDNLGIDITALVAGLGVGGVAVALATQNILGDLFASLSIVIDQPFAIGDFIVVGDFAGTVENIGLKTTRVRSLSGEQLVFGNSDLLGSRIRNYKRMAERRVVFAFGVTYDTPADRLQAIPGMVRELVEAAHDARFDRAHFKGFGDSSLDFEAVYYVTVADYNVYMDVQQDINLGLVRRFAEEGIEFAFPTRTLVLAGAAEKAAARLGAAGD